MLVSYSSLTNSYLSPYLSKIKKDDFLQIVNAGGAKSSVFNVVDDPIDQGDHFEFPITLIDTSDVFLAEEEVGFTAYIAGVTGADGTTGTDGKSAYEIWLDQGNAGTEQDFLDSLIGPPGSGGSGTGDDVVYNVACDSEVFVSSVVMLKKDSPVENPMDTWPSLQILLAIENYSYGRKAFLACADTLENSNVLGVVVDKLSPTLCSIALPGSSTDDIYFGLDVEEEYYLSNVDPGYLISSSNFDLQSGTVLVRVGQALSETKLRLSRGDRRVIP